jgi:hypothetical protein
VTSYSKEETAAHRAEWVDALRSEEYGQTKGQLRNAGRFCCLGVACEVAAKHGVTCRLEEGYASQDDFPATLDLPYTVRDWLGLDSTVGRLVNEDAGEYALDGLNDNAEWTFEQIADLIEAGGVRLKEEL